VLLGLAEAAEARPASTLTLVGLVVVFGVALEVGGGGVSEEEQHVDLEVEQVGDLQPGPQRIQQPGGADRPGVGDRHRRRTARQPRLDAVGQPAVAVAVAEVPADPGGQPQQAVHVQAVDPAQVHSARPA
jgi:hypothetical protein